MKNFLPDQSQLASSFKRNQNLIALSVFSFAVVFISAAVAFTIVNLSYKNKYVYSPQLLSPITPTPTPEPLEFTISRFLTESNTVINGYSGNDDEYWKTMDELELFVQKYPDNARGKAILGNGYLSYIHDSFDQKTKNDLLSKGKKYTDEALAIDPTNFEALHNQFNLYSGNKQNAKAQEIFEKMKEHYPDNLVVKTIEGRLANRSGDYQKAIDLADEVLNQNPEPYIKRFAHVVKIFALDKLRRYDELETTYDAHVENTQRAWDYQEFAIFLINKRRNYEKARVVMKKGLQKMDFIAGRITLQQACVEHGKQLYKEEKYDEAFNSFEEGVEAYPADCGCGYLTTMVNHYAMYASKTGDQSYRDRATEIFKLHSEPQI